MNLQPGWLLILLGGVLLLVGLLWILAPNLPLGRLPGDLRIENGNTRVYIPITTCILLSLVLSAVVWIVRHFSR